MWIIWMCDKQLTVYINQETQPGIINTTCDRICLRLSASNYAISIRSIMFMHKSKCAFFLRNSSIYDPMIISTRLIYTCIADCCYLHSLHWRHASSAAARNQMIFNNTSRQINGIPNWMYKNSIDPLDLPIKNSMKFNEIEHKMLTRHKTEETNESSTVARCLLCIFTVISQLTDNKLDIK